MDYFNEALILIAVMYLIIGALFSGMSRPRGFGADMMFGLLWPVYLVLHITKGR